MINIREAQNRAQKLFGGFRTVFVEYDDKNEIYKVGYEKGGEKLVVGKSRISWEYALDNAEEMFLQGGE